MAQTMQMDDSRSFGTFTFDQLEWRNASAFWDAEGWYGGDYNKIWFKSEGTHADGRTQDASAELLWDRAASTWWNLQAGARHDFGSGPELNWLAVGLRGVAPYFVQTEATLYWGEEGRTAARLKAEYDLYLTQRLILQPKAELNIYGRPDAARGIGAGLSDLDLGVRVRYEWRRELAPYIGLSWTRLFASTADLARAAGRSVSDAQWVAGLRVWF